MAMPAADVMERRRFGRSKREVPVIGQGKLRRGLDLGMTHVDTAEMYGDGAAESLVGKAIAGRRDEVFSALKALHDLDPRQSQIVELRFFGGLTVDETAEVVGLSPATVKREWSAAKLWLLREIDGR